MRSLTGLFLASTAALLVAIPTTAQTPFWSLPDTTVSEPPPPGVLPAPFPVLPPLPTALPPGAPEPIVLGAPAAQVPDQDPPPPPPEAPLPPAPAPLPITLLPPPAESVAIPGNQAPSLDVAASHSVAEGTELRFVVTTSDADTDQEVLVQASALPGGAFIDSTSTFVWTPEYDQAGTHTFTLIAMDTGEPPAYSAASVVSIDVLPVNVAPSFQGSVVISEEDAGPQNLPWATEISPGAPDESEQTVSFAVSTDNPELFSAAPSISAAGMLTFTSAPDAGDSTIVTVVLRDDGGTANGGQDTTMQSFRLHVFAVNDPPVVDAGPDQILDGIELLTTVVLNGTATDVDGDELTYEWTEGEQVLGTGSEAVVNLPTGVHTLTLTVSDGADGVGSDQVVVTILDRMPPEVTAPVAIAGIEATGPLTPIDTGIGTAVDNIDGDLIPVSDAPEGFPVGTTTVTWTATDAAGNVGAATQIVEVVDTTPPTTVAPAAVLAEATGPLTAVEPGLATATDLVGVTAVVSDAPETYSLGTTSVTWTATDAAGNQASATQSVQIVDTTPPAVTAPGDVDGVEATGLLTAVDIGTGSAVDLVDGETSVSSDAPETFAVGTTSVIWSSGDSAGNVGTAVQTVQIVDSSAPVITFALDKALLWPANGKLVRVSGPIGVTDLGDAAPILSIVVTSNQDIVNPEEPILTDDGDDDKKKKPKKDGDDDKKKPRDREPDWQLEIDESGLIQALYLRADRDGKDKDGRIYTVMVTATDASDNESAIVAEVLVPHNKGKGRGAARPVALGDALPLEFSLQQNTPNPFNPETSIRFDLPEPVSVDLRVYDVLGQEIRSLVHEVTGPGAYAVVWDGRNAEGHAVATGTYIFRLVAGSYVETRTMTLLR